jgi:hypothetical protein
MDFDDFLELKWLFPRRRRKPDLDVYAKLTAERGICLYRGQVSPWTSRPCRCEGWEYEKHYRGTIYCTCGDAYHMHGFKRKSTDDGRLNPGPTSPD